MAKDTMTEQFDDQLFDEFAHNFYGYGSYRGQFWFVGMEEGGGKSFSEVNKRLETWAARGKREIDDVAEYLTAIGITHLHNDRPELQSTARHPADRRAANEYFHQIGRLIHADISLPSKIRG